MESPVARGWWSDLRCGGQQIGLDAFANKNPLAALTQVSIINITIIIVVVESVSGCARS
jgi:hypothetical protein